MAYNNKPRYSKKKNKPNNNKNHYGSRKPNWIYSGDLCWFEETQHAFSADVAKDGTWTYTEDIDRVLYSDEPLVYVRRARLKDGAEAHHIESLGLEYVFKGSINAFTKCGPRQRPDTWE